MSDRNSPNDYDGDMQRAKSYGIDAFALSKHLFIMNGWRSNTLADIGVDPYTDAQLGYAYQSAANNGMKVSQLSITAYYITLLILFTYRSSYLVSVDTITAMRTLLTGCSRLQLV
jgi:hypothetical protein